MAEAWTAAGPLRRILRIGLIVQFGGFLFMVAGTHGAFGPQPDPPTTTDFASFYAAGVLANRDTPQLAYDPAAHRAAEAEAVAQGVEEKRFLYPPVFLLLCAPLARLPYLAAFVLFEAASFGLWLLLTARIAGGGALAAMALACIPSVWWALGWGQNSFLSAGLMAAGTLLLRTRPLLAGAAFGGLCFKPHLGLMIPVALLAGRHWRAIAGAVLSAGVLSGLSVAVFGVAAWRGFLDMAAHARATVETGIELAGHVDPGGAARLLGAPASWSWVLQGFATVLSAACVSRLWVTHGGRTGPGRQDELAYAGLIAASILGSPFVLFYDLVMAGVAAAWLVRAGRRDGLPTSLPGSLAILCGLDLLAFPAASLLHLAIGAFVAPALLMLSSVGHPRRVEFKIAAVSRAGETPR